MHRLQNVTEERLRILVIDDDPFLLKTESDMLLDMGYHVVAVGSGFEAIKIFSADPEAFDIVITDQMMPGMMGTQVAKKG